MTDTVDNPKEVVKVSRIDAQQVRLHFKDGTCRTEQVHEVDRPQQTYMGIYYQHIKVGDTVMHTVTSSGFNAGTSRIKIRVTDVIPLWQGRHAYRGVRKG